MGTLMPPALQLGGQPQPHPRPPESEAECGVTKTGVHSGSITMFLSVPSASGAQLAGLPEGESGWISEVWMV